MPRPRRQPIQPSREERDREPEPEPEEAGDQLIAFPFRSLFNTTFTLHRVSPLYLGPTGLPSTRLAILSTRLRDLLVGDVVRGIDLGTGPDSSIFATAGALLAVRLEWVSAPVLLGDGEGRRAIRIELEYENATSSGFLLPSSSEDSSEGGDNFISLPLMLLRMPTSVKAVVIDFLTSTFDCRITALRLGSQDISRCWEAWIRDAGLPRRGPLAKDCAITVAFDLPGASDGLMSDGGGQDDSVFDARGTALKTIDIILANEDLRKFAKAGDAVLASDSAIEKQPFMSALKEYAKEYLALDLGHPAVRIMRIACGGFVLGGERVKIFALEEDAPHSVAVRGLLGLLVARAMG